MRPIYILLIFIVVGGFIIATSYNLNLKESEDRTAFFGKFSGWLFNVGKNLVKTAGYAMKMDWLPETVNKTNNTSAEDNAITYTDYIIKEKN